MRVLMKASMDVETANALVKEGRLDKVIASILDYLKPEAAYFTAEYGLRTAYTLLDLADASEIPKAAEPWMLAFNANIELLPVMALEDLTKASSHFEEAVKRFA